MKLLAQRRSRKARQTGSEVLEFGFVIGPLLAIVFLIINLSWTIFARSTLQFAVREGVRYAITSQTMTGYGQVSSIKSVVQKSALGLLAGSNGLSKIQVHFYTPDTLTDVSSVAGGNAGGNLVEVSVESYTQGGLFPTIKMPGLTSALSPIVMAARSWDRMEASPPTGAPVM